MKLEPVTAGAINVIAGSPVNVINDSPGGTISGGGYSNSPNSLLSADYSAIGGGADNLISNAVGAVIAGGEGHRNFNQWRSFIGSGSGNQMGGTNRFTAGGSGDNAGNAIIEAPSTSSGRIPGPV